MKLQVVTKKVTGAVDGLDAVNIKNIIRLFDSHSVSSLARKMNPIYFQSGFIPIGTQSNAVYKVHAKPKSDLRAFGLFGTLRPKVETTTKKYMKLTVKPDAASFSKK